MQLFYAPDITPPRYTLCEEESKHCVCVLRLNAGDTLHITDGLGNMYRCRIVDPNPKRCSVEVVETTAEYGKMPYGITLAVAPTKNIERFEWFLEKATEVGVTRIVPLECDRSERRIIKYDRELRVITAAVKQSLKAYHPSLDPMTPLRRLVAEPFGGRKFIAHCDDNEEKRKFLASEIRKNENILILIGPEGDFSPEEINFALENGFEPVTLGRQRLRTETAAVVAATMAAVVNGL